MFSERGGYRKLKTFRLAQLIYDITVVFCHRYVDSRGRMRDQMVQAARSGVQNIAEGSQARATSAKMEMKLTGVARASLEELRLDYEDFLRQRGLPIWDPKEPALIRFKAAKCASVDEFRSWISSERALARTASAPSQTRTNTDQHGPSQTEKTTTAEPCGIPARRGDAHINSAERPRSVSTVRSKDCADIRSSEKSFRSSVNVRVRPCPSVLVPSSATLAANGVLALLNLCCYLLDRQLQAQEKQFEQHGGFTENLYRKRIRSRSRQPRR